jgi:copper chaperone CopZ
MAQMVSLSYTVTGEQKIHCAGCEERLRNALRRLPGMQDVQASHNTQRVVVSFDPAQVTPGQVQAKLELLGYRVQPKSDRDGAILFRPNKEAGERGAGKEGVAP